MLDWLGWVATAVFASSYFFKEQVVLRRIQAAAALLWVAYGAMIHALPVVVANLVVASVAVWSTLLRRGEPAVVPVKAEEEAARRPSAPRERPGATRARGSPFGRLGKRSSERPAATSPGAASGRTATEP